MNALELHALKDAINNLDKVLYERLAESNAHRIEHERPFIKGDLQRVRTLLLAIMDNNPEKIDT